MKYGKPHMKHGKTNMKHGKCDMKHVQLCMKHGKAGMNNFLGYIASYEKMQTCKVTYQNLEAWQKRYEALNIVV